jgi:hypothetical protein
MAFISIDNIGHRQILLPHSGHDLIGFLDVLSQQVNTEDIDSSDSACSDMPLNIRATTKVRFLLNNTFTKWLLIANFIAFPIAYYSMTKWLQSFAYRINISLGIFILSTSLALLMAVITISFQSIKAATANPADSLRYE